MRRHMRINGQLHGLTSKHGRLPETGEIVEVVSEDIGTAEILVDDKSRTCYTDALSPLERATIKNAYTGMCEAYGRIPAVGQVVEVLEKKGSMPSLILVDGVERLCVSSALDFSGLEMLCIHWKKIQQRRFVDPETVIALSASIDRHGLAVPLTVRRVGDNYEIVDGHRRFVAARQAGLTSMACTIVGRMAGKGLMPPIGRQAAKTLRVPMDCNVEKLTWDMLHGTRPPPPPKPAVKKDETIIRQGWDNCSRGYCRGDVLIRRDRGYWIIMHPALRLENDFHSALDAMIFVEEHIL